MLDRDGPFYVRSRTRPQSWLETAGNGTVADVEQYFAQQREPNRAAEREIADAWDREREGPRGHHLRRKR